MRTEEMNDFYRRRWYSDSELKGGRFSDSKVGGVGNKHLTLFLPIDANLDWQYVIDRTCNDLADDGNYKCNFHSEKGFHIMMMNAWGQRILANMRVTKEGDAGQLIKLEIGLKSHSFDHALLALREFCTNFNNVTENRRMLMHQSREANGPFVNMVGQERTFAKKWRPEDDHTSSEESGDDSD